MRKFILTSAAALSAFVAAPAFAADTTVVAINASAPQTCDITAAPSSMTLGAVNAQVFGVFTYQCNFIGAPTFTFQSANGGVKTTDNGGYTANYGIYLNDAAPSVPPSSWLQASAATGGGAIYAPPPGISSSAAPNTPVNPSFAVALTQSLAVAGNYSDTLTITIAP